MMLFLAASAAASIAAATPAATPADLFNAFNSVCMATVADPTAATAKARELGFTDPDPPLVKLLASVFTNFNTGARLTIKNDDATEMFIVAKGPTVQHGHYPTLACAIALTHKDNTDVRAAYRATYGSEPEIKEVDEDVYSFQLEDGVKKTVAMRSDNDAAFIKAIDAGQYRAVMVRSTRPSKASVYYDMLVLLVPFKKPDRR